MPYALRLSQAGCLAVAVSGWLIRPAGAEPRVLQAPRAFAPATARPIDHASPSPIRPAGGEPHLVARPTLPAANPKFQLPPSQGAWRLKWREPGVESDAQQVSYEEVIGDEQVRPVDYQLVQAVDPFGDRGVRSPARAPSVQLDPGGRYSKTPAGRAAEDSLPSPTPRYSSQVQVDDEPVLADPPPSPSEAFQPRQTQPGGLEPLDPGPTFPRDPAPLPPPNDLLGPGPGLDPFADPFGMPFGRATDCDRIYNQRNCCEDDERCRMAREFVQRNHIRTISLDITPRFRPGDPALDEAARRDQLSQVPSRVWRNRQGQFVAEGLLVDYRWNRVEIQDPDGEIQRVSPEILSDDDLCFLAAYWNLPTECTLGEVAFETRQWTPMTMTWKASGLCHKPLYFEQVQLERYGHTPGPITEPFLAGAHFFLNVAVIPYRAGINPPTECQYALGYYRPGSCAPWLIPPVPLSFRGAMFQTGAVLGGVYLLP